MVLVVVCFCPQGTEKASAARKSLSFENDVLTRGTHAVMRMHLVGKSREDTTGGHSTTGKNNVEGPSNSAEQTFTLARTKITREGEIRKQTNVLSGSKQ